MKRVLIITVGVIVVGAACLALISTILPEEPEARNTTEDTLKEYVRARDGIAFSYPTVYYLEEKTINEAQRYHYEVILTEDTETNARLRSGEIVGEGPVAITMGIFQNNLDNQSIVGFVTGNSNSNYKLATGAYASTTIAGKEAVTYTWDGLYTGKSIVFMHNDNILMLSVTYDGPQDPILGAFETVVGSLELR